MSGERVIGGRSLEQGHWNGQWNEIPNRYDSLEG